MVVKEMIKIYGYGWVGKHVRKLFGDAHVIDPQFGYKDFTVGEAAFICVPTNLDKKWLDISIVEQVVRDAKEPLIIIRSTVNPGTCDYLSKKYSKKIVFQPEYLGETPRHPLLNPHDREFLIIGGEPAHRRELINIYTRVYNANIKIRQVTNLEAEVIKLTENRAIAFKVMQCQELYDVCQKAGVDYYTVRDAVYGDDPRFNLWFTMIYEKRGFNNSKCIKKDITAWCSWAESVGIDPELTKLLLTKSDDYERLDRVISDAQ